MGSVISNNNMKDIQKAFILGAGLGTRLRPLTSKCPKPMVPILGQPLVKYIFDHLESVGVREMVINTHHCPEVYQKLIGDGHDLGLEIRYSHEEELLDTGGGLKKVEPFFKNGTFIMYNGDILTNGNLSSAVEFHRKKGNLATLILGPWGAPQNVCLNEEGKITDLRGVLGDQHHAKYTFLGIQILEPEIFKFIPPEKAVSIIDIYLELIRKGHKIGGYVWPECFWSDIGNLKSYQDVQRQFIDSPELRDSFKIRSLGQDGSDRVYYRAGLEPHSVVVMRYGKEKQENRFYHPISGFLKNAGLPVPEIFYKDLDHGLLCIEDLGPATLCHAFQEKSKKEILSLYQIVLKEILKLHQKGADLFGKDPFPISRPFTERTYLWESHYFQENLLQETLHLKFSDQVQKGLEMDFKGLARFLSRQTRVLMHRDLQSKNIMIKNGTPYFIDFQGMRLGLAQYDLASLLYDPYVQFTEEEREWLYAYYLEEAGEYFIGEPKHFREVYQKVILQRLMQALGAYGFLGLKKGKRHFLQYIEPALMRLSEVLEKTQGLQALKTAVHLASEKRSATPSACFC